MIVRATDHPEIVLVESPRYRDERGYFRETYRQAAITFAGEPVQFVQDNESFSSSAGTVRGLHLQREPHAQHKLVRVLSGSIFDVAIDLRPGSEFFGRAFTFELNGEAGLQLFVPAGFAHGFQTLEPATRVAYKVSAYYEPPAEAGLFWRDPALAIPWPIGEAGATLSPKDERLPTLANYLDEAGKPIR